MVMTRQHVIGSALSTTALTLFLSSAAAAQVLPSSAQSTTADIVVTAEKKSENIQKVPAQVSVISAANIEQLHATSLEDIGAYVPGLQVNSGGTPGQTIVSLRGIAPVGPSATVASYVDESPVGSSTINAGLSSTGVASSLDLLPYDVERIEVLQGPQGTLYGANSLGGLVKYVLKTPSLDHFHAAVGGDVFDVRGAGNAGGGGRVMLSVPIINGKLAILGSYSSESTPGFIDNAQTGVNNQNHLRQQSARGALLWQPEDNLSVKLGFLWQNSAAANNNQVALDALTLKPVYGDLQNDNFTNEPSNVSLHLYSGQVDWDFGWAKIISVSSYSKTRAIDYQDSTRGNLLLLDLFGFPDGGLVPFRQTLRTNKFTQEVRLSSPSPSKLEWLIGGFYTHERTRDDQIERGLLPDGQSLPPVDLGFGPIPADPLFQANLPSTYREYAAFGDLTYHLTSKLDIAGGVRYAHNKQVFPITASGILIVVQSGAYNAALAGKSSEGVVTYSVGPRYQITDDILAYGRVSSGYQAGGPNIPYPGVPATVKSDRTTNYEAGLKTRFWDRRGILNLTAFWIDWRNIQILGLVPNTGFTYLDNGGTARSRGISADGSITPVTGLTFAANATFTDAKLKADVPAIGARAGDQLPYSPRWSGSAQVNYEWPLGSKLRAHLDAGVRVVGARHSGFIANNSPNAYRLAPYAAADFGASLTFANYTARLFVKNAFDRRAYNYYFYVSDAVLGTVDQIQGTPIQPRTIGLSFDAKF
jgi:iron complex outermembrane receptor protein